MREASTCCSIVDDAAAVGDVAKLERLSLLWGARAALPKVPQNTALCWAHGSDAAFFRACAVRERKAGDLGQALTSERHSDAALKALGQYGKDR